jgi:hypothetical protein
MKAEYDAFMKIKTCMLIELPPSKEPIRYK